MYGDINVGMVPSGPSDYFSARSVPELGYELSYNCMDNRGHFGPQLSFVGPLRLIQKIVKTLDVNTCVLVTF